MATAVTTNWPDELQHLIAGAAVRPHPNPFNSSRYSYIVDTPQHERFYLKVTSSGEDLRVGAENYRWAREHTGLTVPEIVSVGYTEQVSWLMTVALPGATFLASLQDGAPVQETLTRFADGLLSVHSLPIDNCPFRWTVRSVYTGLEQRIDAGEIRPLHTQRPEYTHLTLPEVLDHLRHTCPTDVEESPVVVHHDYALHNVMLLPDNTVGYLDLGRMSVGHRWMDLAIAYHTIVDVAGEEGCRIFFDAYGADMNDTRLKYFSILMDFAY
jgi:kanamycin kinase